MSVTPPSFKELYAAAVWEMDNDPQVALLVRTTTMNHDEARQCVAIARNVGLSVSQFAQQCAKLTTQIGTQLANVFRTFMHGANGLNKIGNVLLNMQLDRVPYPMLRAIVRLGHADKVVVMYDGSTAIKKRGRVFVQASAYLWNDDGKTTFTIGSTDFLCSLGERRYVERDEKFWHSLGFGTLCISSTDPRNYVLKHPPAKRNVNIGTIYDHRLDTVTVDDVDV